MLPTRSPAPLHQHCSTSQFCDEHGNRGNTAAGLPGISVSEVDAKICGVHHAAMYYDVEVSTTSNFLLCMARYLNVKICGVETCYFGVRTHGADPQSPKMSLSLSGAKCNFY